MGRPTVSRLAAKRGSELGGDVDDDEDMVLAEGERNRSIYESNSRSPSLKPRSVRGPAFPDGLSEGMGPYPASSVAVLLK